MRVNRSVATFAAGMVGGVLLTICVLTVSHSRGRRERSNALSNLQAPTARAVSALPQTAASAQSKIIVGDIATVPFQELYGLLSTRSAEELRQVAAQLEDLPPGRETNAKIRAFFKAWSHLDPRTALTSATTFKATDGRRAAISAVIEGADSSAGESLAKSVEGLPSDALSARDRSGFLGSAVSKWSQADAPSAAKFLDGLSNGAGMNFMMAWNSVASNWAATDPQAAIAWANSHPPGQNTSFASQGALLGWWQKDPAAAEAYAIAHLDSEGCQQAAGNLASNMWSRDPERAKQWASSLPNLDARMHANMTIATQWAFDNPSAAAAWAASLPDDVRSGALSSVVGQWGHDDPEAVGQWLKTLNGAARDEAIIGYSYALTHQDPAGAVNWAASISDEQKRTRATDAAVSSWLSRSPADARSWIQNSTLSENEKARLLALPPGG